MTPPSYDTVHTDFAGNKLLSALPPNELETLQRNARLTPLARREVLYEPQRPIESVYFLVDGIVSIVSMMRDGNGVETATIGREGMVGMPVFHGMSSTAEQAIIQVPGQGLRMDAAVFKGLLPELPTLDTLLHRFSCVLFTLAAQNSGCNRKHSIEERCCRWMLMVADRLERDTFELTHDFIAQMLGVRRASVTEALGALEQKGVIRATRGRITIVDRPGLEACSCECYGIIRSSLGQLFALHGNANGNGSGNGIHRATI
jgi:CRP-like cAMP-binding protein